ncbi:glycosyltransferase family 4 protein [Butyricicoccus intestinisimiae]|uniref:Glycosyltransferase family 4 protein n=1 Tax=Butyricicoccus intestinisimiae TaxID=2841509 RepID=A0ABS6ENM9_9FIRM|nr:glycosyltransferase family 4 protein [Butyricicoccus intestinisimiae]MBU5489293.1 glycosyltransferase family 4 protein [Butyricicoccus intestinisimiae]
MKNILFLHAGAEMYGADKVMLDLIKRLDKSKFQPLVILPTEGVLVDALKDEGVNVMVMPYPIMRRKYFNLKGVIQYGFNLIKYINKITSIAKEYHIDLIHTNTAATLEGGFVSRKLHVPHLWSIHEIIVSPKIMYTVTSKLIAKYSSIAITDSKAVKDHLDASGYFQPDAVKVIYNGVDSKRFKPENDCDYLYDEWKIPQNARIIGMMGRVNSWKGQGDFLKAANIIMAKYSDVYTVFVGAAFEGEEWREKELADAIAQSPYKNRIINKGYRTDSEGIYKLYDVFVLPSTNPDPLPTVVLEAMATGKPIVGYKHGGVCEMVKEDYNGLLAEVRNPEDLACKIESLLEDDNKRKNMGVNSRSRLLEKFSIEAYVQNYAAEYDRLTRNNT